MHTLIHTYNTLRYLRRYIHSFNKYLLSACSQILCGPLRSNMTTQNSREGTDMYVLGSIEWASLRTEIIVKVRTEGRQEASRLCKRRGKEHFRQREQHVQMVPSRKEVGVLVKQHEVQTRGAQTKVQKRSRGQVILSLTAVIKSLHFTPNSVGIH